MDGGEASGSTGLEGVDGNRRRLLQLGGIAAAGLAGCLGGSSGDPTTSGSTPATTAPDESDTPIPRTPPPGSQGGIESGDGLGAAFITDNVEMNLHAHAPQAVYDPDGELTVHAYQSTDTGGTSAPEVSSDGDAYAVAFDHARRRVLGPHRIGFNPLWSGDSHGVPGLTIDGDGYVHVFFGCHGGWNTQDPDPAFEYARSADPHRIDEWIHPPSGDTGSGNLPTPAGTYPSPAYNPDEDALYVLSRAGSGGGANRPYPSHVYASLARSGDGGETWTDVNGGVLDFSDAPGQHYDAYVKELGAWGGRLHLTWNISESDHHGQSRHSIYHAAYNPDTGRMETTSGEDLGESITWPQPVEDCLVKDTHLDGDAPGGSPRKSTIRGFRHAYDPESDTAYISAQYLIDKETSALRIYSYEGIADGSGEWAESKVLKEDDGHDLWLPLRINDAGQPEVSDGNQDGREIWTLTEDGVDRRVVPITDIGFPTVVENGPDEFAWIGRERIDSPESSSKRHFHTYIIGEGLGGAATYPRPPRNLRIADRSDGTVTIDWDEGLAGPASLERYDVYVDGDQRLSVTDHPNERTVYPQTFATLDLASGDHKLSVTLTTRDGTESGRSNVVSVSV